MLSHLTIKNYALIDQLEVSFADGFTSITGETGAGKSILLGGLSLVLGKRADLGALQNKDQKCIIEAAFEIKKYRLASFFKQYDLDYEDQTIIRREILPSGKSRAFINDTPITLDILSLLGNRLIDIHSQHQTLQLANNDFQFKVIDALADNKSLLTDFTTEYQTLKKIVNELVHLREVQLKATKEHDYNSFLLSELEKAPLKLGLQEALETQHEELSNVESILEKLAIGGQLMNNDPHGILSQMTELKQAASKLAGLSVSYAELNNRIQSVFIEIDDIATEINALQDRAEVNPALLEEVNGKLQLLYDLQKKHGANDIETLIATRDDLAHKVQISENVDSAIAEKETELKLQETVLDKIAKTLSERRNTIIPQLKTYLEESLASLGMPSASFDINLKETEDFKSNGKDQLSFLFSANKGANFGELKKVASGGELSRIMLTIKAILAKYENLPTMMFDEIDTGVSGEISNKMSEIMRSMSKNMQVFSITHLPQVASKADQHFKVYKIEEANVTHTRMKQLNEDERVVELAEMLGGKDLSDSAIAHARQLLN